MYVYVGSRYSNKEKIPRKLFVKRPCGTGRSGTLHRIYGLRQNITWEFGLHLSFEAAAVSILSCRLRLNILCRVE